MFITNLLAALAALAIGASLYLLTFRLFNLWHPLAVVIVWVVSFFLALSHYIPLWLIVIFLVPILIGSGIATYFLGSSSRFDGDSKYGSAFFVLFPLHALCVQVGLVVGNSWIKVNTTQETIYFLILLFSPVLNSVAVWGWQKKKRALGVKSNALKIERTG